MLEAEIIRTQANKILSEVDQKKLGQFFTPSPIAQFMASLFLKPQKDIRILDPGCGSGILTAASIEFFSKTEDCTKISVITVDLETQTTPFLLKTINLCNRTCSEHGIKLKHEHFIEDFILNKSLVDNSFSHAILNPPYQKISVNSEHRKALKSDGIDSVNLYSAFVGKAIKLLENKGEMVAIIPRSFCNGPYYESFRKYLISETAITHIHIFDSRKKAFADNQVLQENIIIHCAKGLKQGKVTITSSTDADFTFSKKENIFTTENMTKRVVPFNQVIKPTDPHSFIHIATNDNDQAIVDRVTNFSTRIEELELEVSTGPVVGFRLREHLRQDIDKDCAGLIYSSHLKNRVTWPIDKKPNAISINQNTEKLIWENTGTYVLVDRFSSKEQNRRINASIYENTAIPAKFVGFDNKLNVFHKNKKPIDSNLAKGLFVFLNCRLIDKYYRLFGGHTQVNATDLRSLNYPSQDSLTRMGLKLDLNSISQGAIDLIIEKELANMTNNENNPLNVDNKINAAIGILSQLGMPREQQNERSGLTLLALLNLKPENSWNDISFPTSMIGVTPIMNWMETEYGKNYAPNTRETVRRQTLHQFVDAGICLYNPDEPDRAVNSPKACYQITNELSDLLKLYGTSTWEQQLAKYLQNKETLAAQYAMARDMQMIPLTLPNGTKIKLSSGVHSQLIKDIVTEFGPRFAPGSEVIYLGDTGAKQDFFDDKKLASLGVMLDKKGKLPDVVLFWPEKNWLLLIESVTSHGPVDGKRHAELNQLFTDSTAGLVFVTAFPDRKVMNKYLPVISWETEVWVADAPTHMIHFNGDRFLGPHN